MRRSFGRAARRLRNVLQWRRVERDLHDEMEFHIEAAAGAYEAGGMQPDEARRAALLEFGGRDRWTEASRSVRGVPLLQDAGRDMRQAVRSFRRAPGFALAAVLVIALGVGATTSVFSVVRSVLLQPLPYGDPASLYALYEASEGGGMRDMSYPTFEDVAAEAGAVVDMTYARGESVVVRTSEGPQALLGAFTTPNFFPLMDHAPLAGRTFGPDDAQQSVMVLSERVARRLFGTARDALGRTLTTREASYTVTGVMPAGFSYPEWADVWLPLDALPGETRFVLTQRNLHVDSRTVARLRDGVSPEAASDALGVLMARMAAQYPEPGVSFDRAQLTSLREQVVGRVGTQYAAIAGAVVLVLLLACVNVASLLLARGLVRRGELATRLALGAGGGRLIRQLLTESAVLALAGGTAGAALAWLAVARLRAAPPGLLPRVEEMGVDAAVLAFAFIITFVSALLSGAIPALRVTSLAQADALRASRIMGGDRTTIRLRGALVIAQVAIAVVLLVGATLLLRTARALGEQDLGFRPEGVLALRVVPPAEYEDEAAALALFERLRTAAAGVPGVLGAELANHVPLSGAWMSTPVRTSRTPAADQPANAVYRTVSPGYLQLLAARVRHGRLFDEASARGSGVVINSALARREWGDVDPTGRDITVYRNAQGRPGFGDPLPSHVIGVIDDIHEFGAGSAPPPTVYVPFERNIWPNVYLVVRTGLDTAAMLPAIRQAINRVHPDIPTAGPAFWNELHSMDEYRARSVQVQRFATAVLGVFATVAVMLALVGLFAVLAFVVAQRTQEIGIRMALGARPGDAARLVIGQSGRLVVLGVTVGVATAVPATRLVESLLFGVERLDVLSYVAPAVLFAVTALAAAYLPARRASRIDPLRALRLD